MDPRPCGSRGLADGCDVRLRRGASRARANARICADRELACLYRHAEIFCYVSLYEGFGIPVLEAMQSGTAVLTSSVSSMPEVAGGAARLVDPREVASIREGLADLLGDAELRRRGASPASAEQGSSIGATVRVTCSRRSRV